jgi:hypothetical protein
VRGPAVGRGFGEEICEVVEVVGAAGDGRAERAGREVETVEAVVVSEKGAVECEDGCGGGEVDGVARDGVGDEVAGERRVGADKSGKIVTVAVAVTWVQANGGRGGGFREEWHRALMAGAF